MDEPKADQAKKGQKTIAFSTLAASLLSRSHTSAVAEAHARRRKCSNKVIFDAKCEYICSHAMEWRRIKSTKSRELVLKLVHEEREPMDLQMGKIPSSAHVFAVRIIPTKQCQERSFEAAAAENFKNEINDVSNISP